MVKTVDMVLDIKRAIQEAPDMYMAVEAISKELYNKGVVKTADEINDTWTNLLLAMLYQNNPQARAIISQEVWESANA